MKIDRKKQNLNSEIYYLKNNLGNVSYALKDFDDFVSSFPNLLNNYSVVYYRRKDEGYVRKFDNKKFKYREGLKTILEKMEKDYKEQMEILKTKLEKL